MINLAISINVKRINESLNQNNKNQNYKFDLHLYRNQTSLFQFKIAPRVNMAERNQNRKKRKREEEEHEEDEEEPRPHKKQKQEQEEEEDDKKQTRKKSKKKKKEKEKDKNKVKETSQEEEKPLEQPKSKKKKKKSKKHQERKEQQQSPPRENAPSDKKSKKKKHTKQAQEQHPLQQALTKVPTIPEPKTKSSKKKPQTHQQKQPEQVKQQQQQAQQPKTKKHSKSSPKAKQPQSKKKPPKIESINVINRQLAKQCVTKKSNFYLQKQQRLKQGLQVGRGAKRKEQKKEQQKKRILSQRNKKKKMIKKQEEASVKEEEDDDTQSKSTKPTVVKKKKDQCSKEQSIRIINLFSVDAGDYRGMVKELSDIPLAKIRGHLRMLFERSLEIITKRVQDSGRKINDWEIMERREIVRELHRIRCTNRLLSEQNVEFRDKFLKLMMNYNDPTLALTDADCNYLYRKIQAFVRGFCSLGTSRKKSEVKFEDTLQENRQPLLEGGYIMDRNRVKRQVKIQQKLQQVESKKLDPEKMILQWTQEQEKELGQLYILHQANTEAIHEQLKIKFGLKNKWKDFQLLNRKIDHLVKMGLNKLQELTLKPYKREERIREEESKKKLPVKETDPTNKTEISSLDLMTKFIYNNKRVVVSKDQNLEGGLFKNLPLLQRQIFGHVQSIKSRFALVKLLNEKFPPEEHVEEAIRIIKQFVAYAIEWERKNRILLMRQEPVLEEPISTLPPRVFEKELSSESSSDSEDKFQVLVEPNKQKGSRQFEGTNDQFQFLSEDQNIEEMMKEALND